MAKIVLPINKDNLFKAYEGHDTSKNTELTGENFNKPNLQLLLDIEKIVEEINSGNVGGSVIIVDKLPPEDEMEANTWYVEASTDESAEVHVILVVTPTLLTLNLNESETLVVEVANAEDHSVTFTSADPTIATVDSNGVVRGVYPGTTSIIVTSNQDNSVSMSVSVTVN